MIPVVLVVLLTSTVVAVQSSDADPQLIFRSILIQNQSSSTTDSRFLPFLSDAAQFALSFQQSLKRLEEKLQRLPEALTYDSPHSRSTSSDPRIQQLVRHGLMGHSALRYMTFQSKPSFEDFIDFQVVGNLGINLRGTVLQGVCRAIPKCLNIPMMAGIEYRRPDGACNNRLFPHIGMATGGYFREIISIAYYDDFFDHERTMSVDRVTKLPGARLVSVKLHGHPHSERKTDSSLNLLFMQMGQFIAHDFTEIVVFRPDQRVVLGAGFDCCSPTILADGTMRHPECFAIPVPVDDPFYSEHRVKCLNFLRAAPVPPWDCAVGTREQMNSQTSFIDLSSMYGSDEDRVNSLRSFKHGLLMEQQLFGKGFMPPIKAPNECSIPQSSNYSCFKTGDDRGNMHIQIVALHVVFLRNHNKYANILSTMNPHWNDERTFQETRRLMSGLFQHIVYGEHLPLMIGPDFMAQHDLYPKTDGFYTGYSAFVDAGAGLAVSHGAYRLHNQIVGRLDLYSSPGGHKSKDKLTKSGKAQLSDTYFDPRILEQGHVSKVDSFLNGMMMQPMSAFRRFVDAAVTEHLFHAPGQAFGADLASMYIQRGRDVGLSGFNSWVQFCGKTKYVDIDDMNRDFDPEFVEGLKGLFVNVDDIDFWSAGLHEKVVKGAAVGTTFACVIAAHFARLKRGDRFWYESPETGIAFSASQLKQIRRVTMARLMCDGGDDVRTVPKQAFLFPSDKNPLVPCSQVPALDLSPWKINTSPTNNFLQISFPVGGRRR